MRLFPARSLPFRLVAALFLTAAPALLHAQALPSDEAGALDRLNGSPRHGEWVTIDAGGGDRLTAWVVHPERPDPAPVVVVIHEIYGLTDWIRSVADQLAADGFLAVAPDLLSGKGPGGGGTSSVDQQGAVRLIRDLSSGEILRRLDATASWATALPSTTDRVGSIGFCWGGGTSFTLASLDPELDAAVVYYGTSPVPDELHAVQTPILGLYGGNDARVNATIEPARDMLETHGARYDVEIYEGAGHGFLRQQSGQEGANMAATRQAWPRTVAFLRETLGR